jgi:hypothetical protein
MGERKGNARWESETLLTGRGTRSPIFCNWYFRASGLYRYMKLEVIAAQPRAEYGLVVWAHDLGLMIAKNLGILSIG